MLRPKTSTDVLDGPYVRSPGITANHRFADPRIRGDPLQRITLLKSVASDRLHKTKYLAWNLISAGDDNTKTAAQVKTT
jgi:hypothetical protein